MSAKKAQRPEVYLVCRCGYDRRLRLLITFPASVALVFLICIAGCGEPPAKTNAELGLNAQQASGRQTFVRNCSGCHNAYSSWGSKGPSLKRLFRKQFLPSGLPANDRFVRETIVSGRGMMPAQGDSITVQQLDDLIAYLHTL